MKKLFLLPCIFLFFITTSCGVTQKFKFSPSLSEEEFDVTYLVDYKYLNPAESPKFEELHVNQSVDMNYKGCKALFRFSLFKDLGINKNEIEKQFAMLTQTVLYNLDPNFDYELSDFSPEAVKKEFNGDMGVTTTIINSKSPFFEGYQFATIDIFYKYGQGAVVRTTLFNDLSFIMPDSTGLSPQLNFYHNFEFQN